MSRPKSLQQIAARLAELGQPITLRDLRVRAKAQRQMQCRAWYLSTCDTCGKEWEAKAGTRIRCPDCGSHQVSYRLYRIVERFRDGGETEFVNVAGDWQKLRGAATPTETK